jgi:hypothetical protein
MNAMKMKMKPLARFVTVTAMTGSVIGASMVAPQSMLRGEKNMPSQAQKAFTIVMVPKFTGTAYFAATEKGAREAVAELKSNGAAIDFVYTGPSVARFSPVVRPRTRKNSDAHANSMLFDWTESCVRRNRADAQNTARNRRRDDRADRQRATRRREYQRVASVARHIA